MFLFFPWHLVLWQSWVKKSKPLMLTRFRQKRKKKKKRGQNTKKLKNPSSVFLKTMTRWRLQQDISKINLMYKTSAFVFQIQPLNLLGYVSGEYLLLGNVQSDNSWDYKHKFYPLCKVDWSHGQNIRADYWISTN